LNDVKICCRLKSRDLILIPVFVRSALLSSLLLSSIALAAPAIGIITASGHFSVEGSQVWGNATLFDGTTVETSSASSELALRNGVKVQLSAGSRARIWQNRLVLEKGVAQLAAPAAFEARVFTQAKLIRAPFRGRVALQVTPGQIVRTGCMVYKDGRFLLQDQTTQEVTELAGPDLAANVGNRVEARGAASTTTAVAPATGVMNVASIALVSQGGCLSVAAALDARTDVPAPGTPTTAKGPAGAKPPAQVSQAPEASAGMSTGVKVAIIGAIAGGGAGAALALGGGKSSTSQ